MKGILRYLKDYKKESILAPLFKMLEATFELLIPIVMANVIDVGIAGRDISYVVKMCLVMILLGIIGLVCSITAQYFSAKAATGFGTALRNDLFRHITSLSYTEIDSIGTSTLLTRMTSDTNQVQTGVNMVLRLFLRSPFIVFGAMIMSFTIDVKSAMTFVVTIPALSIVVFGVMALSIPLFKKVQNRLDRVTLLTREGLEGARVIRAFNRQDKEFEEFEQQSQEFDARMQRIDEKREASGQNAMLEQVRTWQQEQDTEPDKYAVFDTMSADWGGEEDGFVFYEIPEDYSRTGGYFPEKMQVYTYCVCKQYGVRYDLVVALIEKESGYKFDKVGDDGHSIGYMQIYEECHRDRMERLNVTDLTNPYQNVLVGIDYLSELIERYGTIQDALAAYNYGEQGAKQHLWKNGIYVYEYNQTIMSRMKEIEEELEQDAGD